MEPTFIILFIVSLLLVLTIFIVTRKKWEDYSEFKKVAVGLNLVAIIYEVIFWLCLVDIFPSRIRFGAELGDILYVIVFGVIFFMHLLATLGMTLSRDVHPMFYIVVGSSGVLFFVRQTILSYL